MTLKPHSDSPIPTTRQGKPAGPVRVFFFLLSLRGRVFFFAVVAGGRVFFFAVVAGGRVFFFAVVAGGGGCVLLFAVVVVPGALFLGLSLLTYVAGLKLARGGGGAQPIAAPSGGLGGAEPPPPPFADLS